MSQPKPMDRIDVQTALKSAIQDAVNYVEEEVGENRIKAQRYFDGETDIGYEKGRSKVVSTKVRDAIRGAKPSLMRVFLSNDKYVEFVPKTAQQVAQAEQATTYIHWALNESDGYNVLNNAFHDALLKKTGIVKVYWEDYYEVDIRELTNLEEPQYLSVVNRDDVEVIEQMKEAVVSVDETGAEIERNVYSVKIGVTREEGKLCVEGVPPEEFFINAYARSITDNIICGHRT